MDAILPIGMRWLHLASVIVLLGGIFYARVAVGDMAQGFKPVAYAAIGGILVSGLYIFLSKGPLSSDYQMWFGIKMLLALHVFAVTILYKGKPRLLTGAAITGGVIVGIAGYLRWITR
ncbi:MAG TPA: hypothetical protein VGG72_04470 [Bryobacteraceae bacterium]|jgi:hypothetical protein